MLQNQMMASKRGKIDLKNVPLRSFKLSSLTVANKISLKEKLMAELALVRSAIDKIGGAVPGKEQCCQTASKSARSSNQQQVSSTRKRKLSEIYQGSNTVDGRSEVTHLHSHDSNIVLSDGASNIDSNSSVCAPRKKHCSAANGFDERRCEKMLTSTKAFHVAKRKSRFADTITKAQLDLQNIGLRERTFRMQQERDKLAAYREETSRIEAQRKSAVAAIQKAKSELKMKIKKEREASRLALEEMKPTVEIDDFHQVVKELKRLGCQNISFYVLRQLGLFLKEDNFDDHKITRISIPENDELEEGEILI